jgi:hypothetical protein
VDNVWGANSQRTSASSNADTFETKRKKRLCDGEIAGASVIVNEAKRVIDSEHHGAASPILQCGNGSVINNDLLNAG